MSASRSLQAPLPGRALVAAFEPALFHDALFLSCASLSSVQESDGSFFESYTALCWKQENRRLQALREDDDPGLSRQEDDENELTSSPSISPKEVRLQSVLEPL